MFKINEIFTSIQGEGQNTGMLSLFIRVYGCDYACSFCDSSSASVWELKNYKEYTTEQLINEIKEKTNNTNITNIVLTGGNPLIYDFQEIIDTFKSEFFTFEVETQGSKFMNWILDVDLITISPKFYHKNYIKHNLDFLEKIFKSTDENKNIVESGWDKKLQLKFIIDTKDLKKDFNNIEKFIDEVYFGKLIYLDSKDEKGSCSFKTRTQLQNIYLHFVAEEEDYNNSVYIEKFKKIYNDILINKKQSIKLLAKKIRLGVQLHKLLELE